MSNSQQGTTHSYPEFETTISMTDLCQRLHWQMLVLRSVLKRRAEYGKTLGMLHGILNDHHVASVDKHIIPADQAIFQRLYRWGSDARGHLKKKRIDRVVNVLIEAIQDKHDVSAPETSPKEIAA